ncbi:ABC transporter ATP-binding protein [Mesorhizobium sp. CU2]|uniref:ABC transporter ATP-binding protein n=1 Tax=unclassified Mesorhizobium TaxID=325217 RepID=UPI00112C72C5|nr:MULTISPECIES: ABC transporter ATP-binding protein [unclassified Mesorhizobium]TPN81122.1 ABC transporter ATP-binding protein [Mesorhizobium sp. CU3]TPO17080.1 ABC transporter ATP-binding protein [Mesorhizobium sp. CU2]
MSEGVELSDVSVNFGSFRAVNNVSVSIKSGEFFSFLGPSGCGKTTILRTVSGFIAPSAGVVSIGGQDMAGIGPNRRPTALIFQNLALFPLMSVWENIAFGLEVRGAPKAARRAKAEELLRLVDLPGAADKAIAQLSGGQKQRVAIARALAVEPKVMLLDEPLSALDLKLRQHMRTELRAIQKRTNITFIYITHDQGEALAMSDRIGVMSQGKLQQVDTPKNIYENPANGFVASFVGENNVFKGKLEDVQAGVGTFLAYGGEVLRARVGPGVKAYSEAKLYVRPERVTLSPLGATPRRGANSAAVKITSVAFEGNFISVNASDNRGRRYTVQVPNDASVWVPPLDAEARLEFDPDKATVLQDELAVRDSEQGENTRGRQSFALEFAQ